MIIKLDCTNCFAGSVETTEDRVEDYSTPCPECGYDSPLDAAGLGKARQFECVRFTYHNPEPEQYTVLVDSVDEIGLYGFYLTTLSTIERNMLWETVEILEAFFFRFRWMNIEYGEFLTRIS